jgi:diguanylate cyclase (GGDEF)-like protein
VRQAFIDRPHLVEKAAGFCGLNVLTDSTDAAVFLLLTRWTDEQSFRAWHRSDAHHQSHAGMPQGLKLDATFTCLTIGNSIEDPAGIHNLSDAVEAQSSAIAHWLSESEVVFALLLEPDGSIRTLNRASRRVFGSGAKENSGSSIWEHLASSGAEQLRERLSGPLGQNHGGMRLNVADGEQNPITLEVGLIRCGSLTLMLGTPESRHDSQFRAESLKLTNELSLMVRESAQKNRELKEANETIEGLARTDALTGLANRRTLDEAFQREIARAKRQGQSLSIIMADLDGFKSVNDQYGHIAGDQVLAGAAGIFGSQMRPYDLAARYGGEEFVCLLPGASAKDALTIAERIRKEIEKIAVPACPRQITVSSGVANWLRGETAEKFVARADAALYKAKSGGRNRVESA